MFINPACTTEIKNFVAIDSFPVQQKDRKRLKVNITKLLNDNNKKKNY